MAKNNNLTDFLTDVADAIRAKKGTTAKINPQDFSAEIASIQTGGNVAGVQKSDVNFYDYDGTILYSYTKAAFLALSSAPKSPTREGLTFQGWNYTLSDAKTYVAIYGVLDIGATYITDDGKTRLYIRISTRGRMTVPIYFYQAAANGVEIDWGDGSATQTVDANSYQYATHTYAEIGDYVITLKAISGTYSLGGKSTSLCVMGSLGTTGRVYCNMLQKVELGSDVSLEPYAFSNCYSLASVTLPRGTAISANCFRNCYSLKCVVMPDNISSVGGYAFHSCSSLETIVFPKTIVDVGSYAFYNCMALASVVLPWQLSSRVIPDNVFYSCQSLPSIVMPANVSTIASNAFYGCYGVAFYDFRNAVAVPTLANTNAFGQGATDFKIVVPDSLYSSWTTATNWSNYTYASKIVKASEFNA